MDKQKALAEIQLLFKEIAELRKITQAPEVTPKSFLLGVLSKPFEVKVTEGYITYFQDNKIIFQQDLKSKILWCSHKNIWQTFESIFSLKFVEIQKLIKEVVGEALNCKDFIPFEEWVKHVPLAYDWQRMKDELAFKSAVHFNYYMNEDGKAVSFDNVVNSIFNK